MPRPRTFSLSDFPDAAALWHPEKNGYVTPADVAANSKKHYWWLGECGHEWETSVGLRVRNRDKPGCPYCTGHKALRGFNDLATMFPGIAAQWHPTKNGELTSADVAQFTHARAWWLGPCGHEWDAPVRERTANGAECPYCSGRRVLPGFNDLSTTHPWLASSGIRRRTRRPPRALWRDRVAMPGGSARAGTNGTTASPLVLHTALAAPSVRIIVSSPDSTTWQRLIQSSRRNGTR